MTFILQCICTLKYFKKCHTSVYENATHLFGKIACVLNALQVVYVLNFEEKCRPWKQLKSDNFQTSTWYTCI